MEKRKSNKIKITIKFKNVLTMKSILFLFIILMGLGFTSCTENYSNGERVGFVTKLSRKGLVWKSWEGQLNLTQTGMNTSGAPFDFSIDNDREPAGLVARIDSAATLGWKVKLRYHEVAGWNWFDNRGSTNFFVTECEVLDGKPVQMIREVPTDTIWVDPRPDLQ